MRGSIRQLLLPTGLEYLWYGVLSIILLVLTHFQIIISFFTDDSDASSSLTSIIQIEIDRFLDLLSSYSFSGSTVVFGFWLLVGALIYVLAVFLFEFFSEGTYIFHEETDFVHRADYHSGSAAKAFAIRSALHLAIFIVFAAYILVFINFLWPLLGHLLESFFNDPLNAVMWLLVILSVTGTMLCLHIGSVLLRLTFLRSRVFTRS